MSKSIQAVRGMNDVLPSDSCWWMWFEAEVRDWLDQYGYRNIRMPLVESTDLFVRSIGEVTDIVEKEMYTFEDKLNGDSLTLRPEGTASCLRAVIEHNLLYNAPQRLWYQGPMFRHERPQKGRYRQFHQVGVEALGFVGPDIDAELLLMTADLWRRLGLQQSVTLQLNSLGSREARAAYRSSLIAYLEQHQDVLDEDGRRRLHSNPLRVLDTKNPAMAEVVAGAPQLLDVLDEASAQHFSELRAILDAQGVAYSINPRLVRGLDYYNGTVFEWVTTELGAQGTVCAGGRYDGLMEQLGGKAAPACGFGMGVERLLLLLQAHREAPQPVLDVYVVHQGEQASRFAWDVAVALRAAGLAVVQHCGGGSFKSQFKKADASGARYALVIGDDEAARQQVSLKPLRGEGQQSVVAVAEAIACIKA